MATVLEQQVEQPERLLSLAQVCGILGYGRTKLYARLQKPEVRRLLRPFHDGRQVKFRASRVHDYIAYLEASEAE